MMAQDVEVAPSFQPLLGLAANFLRSHESQVADPMIEASWACGRYLSEKRAEPAPAFVETHDDIAVQIENEYAPEYAEGDGIRIGLKHGPERVAAGETRQDGGQENRRTDPSIGVVFCGAVPRAQNRHIGSRTKPEEPLHEVRSWQRDRRERTHVHGYL